MDTKYISELLNDGGIVVIPTDTVYGIVCDALNIKAVDKVYKLKQRDYSKPMVILVSSIDMLKKYTLSINKLEEELINRYLPGMMTIVLRKNNLIPDIVSSNRDTIGIRIPDNNDLISIINKINRPIIATSCNISNNDVITDINLLDSSIKNNVDYVYDGGIVNSQSSTIVRIKDNKVEILRKGKLASDIEYNYLRKE